MTTAFKRTETAFTRLTDTALRVRHAELTDHLTLPRDATFTGASILTVQTAQIMGLKRFT